MTEPVTSKIIRPEQCAFAFGIPMSKEDFVISRRAIGDHYAHRYSNWEDYDKYFVRNATEFQSASNQLGVDVRCYISCAEFSALFNGKSDVVILFSHWNGEAVEFAKGFSTAFEVVNSINVSDFAGIVDLSICQSEILGDALKQRFPNCVVRVGKKRRSPDLWLAYYLALFKQLKDNNFSYFDADHENRTLVRRLKREHAAFSR